MTVEKQLVDLDFDSAARGVNHLDPVNPQDVATKNYVDNNVSADDPSFAYMMS